MTKVLSLATHLLLQLDDGTKGMRSQLADLERTLQDTLRSARAAWPTLQVTPERYIELVAERLPPDADPCKALHSLHTDDLYLVCACLDGSERAIEALEGRYFGVIPAALKRLNVSSAVVEETRQILREQLFVGSGGGRPQLMSYQGRGGLLGWLRVVAVRTAMRLMDRTGREVPIHPLDIDHLIGCSRDPELSYIREAYRDSFKAAFKEALGGLDVRQRNLLKQHFLDGVSIVDLSRIYQAHRVTISRWINDARLTLLRRTQEILVQDLGVSPAEGQSLIGLLDSQIDVTLSLFYDSTD